MGRICDFFRKTLKLPITVYSLDDFIETVEKEGGTKVTAFPDFNNSYFVDDGSDKPQIESIVPIIYRSVSVARRTIKYRETCRLIIDRYDMVNFRRDDFKGGQDVEKCVNYLVKNHFPELKERYFYFRFGMPYSQSDASSQSPATFMNLAMKRHYGIELRGDLEYAEQDVVKGVLAQQLSGILLSETPSKDAAMHIDDIASERGCKKYIDAAILYERKISKNGKKD